MYLAEKYFLGMFLLGKLNIKKKIRVSVLNDLMSHLPNESQCY